MRRLPGRDATFNALRLPCPVGSLFRKERQMAECVDPFSVETVRATMGSIFALPIVKCTQAEFIADRDRWTGSVVGTLLTATHDHRSAPYQRPTLILMGTEQSGLSPEVAAICDTHVKIPMRGRADSLNLSVATGIMIYAATEV